MINALVGLVVHNRLRLLLVAVFLILHSACAERIAPNSAVHRDEPSTEAVSKTIQLPPLFVGDATSLDYDIPVKNETSRPLEFTRIRQSCACAGSSRLAAMELAPGQETVLHLHIDLRQRKGPQRFVCALVEAGGAEWTYTLETTIHERARFEGPGAMHFGMIDPKSEAKRDTQFTLHAHKAEVLPKDVSFAATAENLKIDSGPAAVQHLPDGTTTCTYPIRLRLQWPESSGPRQCSICAHFECEGEKKVVQMNVTWSVRTLYVVTPSEVYFGSVDPKAVEPIKRHIVFGRADRQPLTIKRASVSCAGVFVFLEQLNEGSMYRVLLLLDPKTINESIWGEAVIETDYIAQPQLRIPLAALYSPK
jgi:hypothetical protein